MNLVSHTVGVKATITGPNAFKIAAKGAYSIRVTCCRGATFAWRIPSFWRRLLYGYTLEAECSECGSVASMSFK